MILSENEKETLVTELLKKGLAVRDIARQAHVSFSYIHKIKTKITGETDEVDKEKKKPLSIPSQALKLFLDGKTIVQVAIGLDLTTDQALRIHSEYFVLRNM